jgi:transposase
MSGSGGIDSIFGGRSMPKPCSLDLRERVLDAVETDASHREAAERFEVSASSAVKRMQRWHETGSVAAKPTGGSISPLEKHADCLLALIAEQPDLTLDEIVAAMRKRRMAGSRSAAWRLFVRHGISFKKVCGRRSKSGPTWPARAGIGCASKACLTRRGWCSSMKPQPQPTWYGFEAAADAVSG